MLRFTREPLPLVVVLRWEVKDKFDAEITDLKKNGASVKW
jgi:hypothetical protein